ncbi:MAG: transcription-repair coupling factor, partial [Pseudomonadota bacterium]
RPLVVVTADDLQALRIIRDIGFFLGAGTQEGSDAGAGPTVLSFPPSDTSPYAELSPDRFAILERLATLFRLSQGSGGDVLVASVPALLRRMMPREGLGELCDLVLPEEEIDRERLISLCVRAGYNRVGLVEDPGTFAVRGGVIDVFSPLHRYPVRIDLYGDLVESIRTFDAKTQRTMRALDEFYIHPVRETARTRGADPRARVLAAADAVDHPSTKTRAILEHVETGTEFLGMEAFTPAFHARMASIAEYLPDDARWLVVDPEGVWRAVADELTDAETRFQARLADHRLALPPAEHYLSLEELAAMFGRARTLVEMRSLEVHEPRTEAAPTIRFAVERNTVIQHELARARHEKANELLHPLVARLRASRDEGSRVVLVCPNAAHADRLQRLLAGYGIEAAIAPASDLFANLRHGSQPAILIGQLSDGFWLPADLLLVVTEEEIFGPRARTCRKTPTSSKATQIFNAGAADFSQLKVGDYLVHAVHGVGVYQGLTKLPQVGPAIDFLQISYEGGSLYLPVYRLSEVARYIGAEGSKPRLDRLGGVTWERTKRKVSAEVKKLAEELLQLYAQRKALPGHAFPPADAMFGEFEATFPFEETPDQERAITEVLADMERPLPMDRLVCGDVGYGKTEVALRAALKAVLGGKQAAVLAPTTVLVEQHFGTFRERFGNWPVTVGALSRFSSRAEQLETIRLLGDGKIDVVIGTHRLLSSDVRFKDLGLLIIDEEQRFGVVHKERLKKLRTQIDVLTLTATPIPRTLHLGLMGMRDVSIIATPPADRLAVRTFVCRPDDDVIREGIGRELARGGQVFFVCHRIGERAETAPSRSAAAAPAAAGASAAASQGSAGPGSGTGSAGGRSSRGRASSTSRSAAAGALRRERSLVEWAEHIREICPDARVAVAHGQMDPEALEEIMVSFVAHQYDVLVCTTIVESGLDIPRANTMFINRSDTFGLAQLYQLRGRIGRSKERAFCFLMAPAESVLTNEAKQRLQVLQRFSELGAGFQIAVHDLEIRGAGDLLGAEQSGQIAAVGFDTYARILEEAVAELQGEAIHPELDPELNVDIPAYIPDDYVPDTGQRLDLYKRLASADAEERVREVLEEINDRYGELPSEVGLLGELMIAKTHARRLGVVAIEVNQHKLVLSLDSKRTTLQPDRVLALVTRPRTLYRLTPDMRLLRSFSEQEKLDRMRTVRQCLLELLECANDSAGDDQ